MKKLFLQLLSETGYEPFAYSGRGMYGKYCLAIRENVTEIVLKIVEHYIKNYYNKDYSDCYIDDLFTTLNNYRTDQLGMGTVTYFPDIEFNPDET